MKKFFLLIILLSSELFSSTIIGNPNVEINSEGLYLIQIKLTSTKDITEDDIFIAVSYTHLTLPTTPYV